MVEHLFVARIHDRARVEQQVGEPGMVGDAGRAVEIGLQPSLIAPVGPEVGVGVGAASSKSFAARKMPLALVTSARRKRLKQAYKIGS